MESADFGALGFWIFVAAIAASGMWIDARKKAEKHETLRRIVEKTGTVDEARLRELFSEEPAVGNPGYAYRGLRITGTIVLFVAAAIITFFLIAALLAKLFGPVEMLKELPAALSIAFAVSAALAVVGVGLFYSSRFATPPPAVGNEPPAK